MSYYNYAVHPVRLGKEDAVMSQYCESRYLVFNEYEDGFNELALFLGESLVTEFPSGAKIIFLEFVNDVVSDYIRPRDLEGQQSLSPRKCWYGDADCCIKVSEMEHKIDWSKVEDITATEDALRRYQKGLNKYGDKLLIYPL